MSSTTESESDLDESVTRDEDENLTAEQLRQKYAHLETTPTWSSRIDTESELEDPFELNISVNDTDKEEKIDQAQPLSSAAGDEGANARPSSMSTEVERIDPMLPDESEEELTAMDDGDESGSDESSSVEGSSEEGEESGDDESPNSLGLLGFFSGQDLEDMKRKAELTEAPSSVNEQESDAVNPEPSYKDQLVTDDEIGDDDEVELVTAGSTLQSTRTATPINSE
ncbi:hypothetical protein KEM54_004748, partial [Ascosphaera aggregata]